MASALSCASDFVASVGLFSRDLERGASAGFLFRGTFFSGGGCGAGFFLGDAGALALALSSTGAEMSGTSAAVSVVVKVLLPFLGGIWSFGTVAVRGFCGEMYVDFVSHRLRHIRSGYLIDAEDDLLILK